MTRHEKIGLMCTLNLTIFLDFLSFHNFVPKQISSVKFWKLVQYAMENLMQFTELVYIACTEGEIHVIILRGDFV